MTNQAEAFRFVNLSEPKEGKNEDLRKLVRSNAMRNYRQKQKQKAESPSMPETSHTVQLPMNDQPQFVAIASRRLGTGRLSLRGQGYHEWAANPQSVSMNDPALVQAITVFADREGKEHQDPGLATSRVRSIPRTELSLSSRSLSGGGLDDPFDVLPIHGDRSHNSHLLNHCRC